MSSPQVSSDKSEEAIRKLVYGIVGTLIATGIIGLVSFFVSHSSKMASIQASASNTSNSLNTLVDEFRLFKDVLLKDTAAMQTEIRLSSENAEKRDARISRIEERLTNIEKKVP